MSKILGSFSGMRKYLEKDMTATSLQGRIRYGCTTYEGMDGCYVFTVYVDKIPVKHFSLETLNAYFIKNGYTKNKTPCGTREYWEEFWDLWDKYSILERTEYTHDEFCEALEAYRNQDIRDSINSENPIVRMFAVLDRRIGKRTLQKAKESIEAQPQWLRQFYELRFEAENI